MEDIQLSSDGIIYSTVLNCQDTEAYQYKNIFLLVKPFRLGKYNNSKMQDQRAKEDLTLNRVERDVLRRLQIFTKSERAREQLERIAKEHADEWAEKKRL